MPPKAGSILESNKKKKSKSAVSNLLRSAEEPDRIDHRHETDNVGHEKISRYAIRASDQGV